MALQSPSCTGATPDPPPHELAWNWVPADIAAEAAREGNALTEALRTGHSLLSVDVFAQALESSEVEMLMVPAHHCAALVTWGAGFDGRVCSILTVAGRLRTWDQALPILETAVAARGADAVLAIAHAGWLRLARRHGYDTARRIVMRKFL